MAYEENARFYTRSRRFPKMIGRMTDGSRIPGGPYTLTQVGFGGFALLILLMTRTMWSTGSVILDLAITVGVAWGVTWVVGLIPMTRRNLLFAFVDAIAAMLKPHGGKYQGRVINLVKPHQAIGAAHGLAPVQQEPDDADPVTPEPVPAPKPAPVPPAIARRAVAAAPHPTMSAVEQLLHKAKNNS